MSCTKWNVLSGHMQTAKVHIIFIVWSGPSLTTNRIIGYYKMYERRSITQVILCICAGWSESVQFGHVWRHIWTWPIYDGDVGVLTEPIGLSFHFKLMDSGLSGLQARRIFCNLSMQKSIIEPKFWKFCGTLSINKWFGPKFKIEESPGINRLNFDIETIRKQMYTSSTCNKFDSVDFKVHIFWRYLNPCSLKRQTYMYLNPFILERQSYMYLLLSLQDIIWDCEQCLRLPSDIYTVLPSCLNWHRMPSRSQHLLMVQNTWLP